VLLEALTGLPAGVRLRKISPDDLSFLERLYASTRVEELNQVDWPPEQKQAFLKQQFEAQHGHYQQHFTHAEYLLIEHRPAPSDQTAPWQRIGRLYLDERDEEIRLIDIALLPEMRSAGLGSLLLEKLLSIAKERDLAVRIHVEQFNPAAEWYRRYGFRLLEDRGVYLFMEWRADA